MVLTTVAGAGSVISNVLDYSKWIKAFLTTSGPISKDGYKTIKTPRMINEPGEGPSPFTGPQAYSLGWSTGVYHGYEFFEHSGGMISFGAEVIIFPKLNYGLVGLGNTAMTSNFVEWRALWHLVDEHLNIPHNERFDWHKK